MRKFAALVSLLVAFTARAELLEYTVTTVAHGLGDGIAGTATIRGLMIYDTATTNLTLVGFASNKTYERVVLTNYQMVQLTAPLAKTYTAIVTSTTDHDQNGKLKINSDLIKGLNRTLKIGTNATYVFPAVLSGIRDRQIGVGPHGGTFLVETTDTFVYNQTRTIADHDANRTPAEVAANYSAYLEGLGYTLVP